MCIFMAVVTAQLLTKVSKSEHGDGRDLFGSLVVCKHFLHSKKVLIAVLHCAVMRTLQRSFSKFVLPFETKLFKVEHFIKNLHVSA
jgi:hypothetical protein